jgi:hypothetical protein
MHDGARFDRERGVALGISTASIGLGVGARAIAAQARSCHAWA